MERRRKDPMKDSELDSTGLGYWFTPIPQDFEKVLGRIA
jgi:hypothetical protein